MSEVICEVCGRKLDSRGLSGHMKTHVDKKSGSDGQDNGVISYPSNESEMDVKQDVVPGNTETPDNVKQPKKKKPVKKTVASKSASSPASNSGSKSTGHPKDSGVTETNAGSKNTAHPKDSGAHKQEWQGLFRD